MPRREVLEQMRKKKARLDATAAVQPAPRAVKDDATPFSLGFNLCQPHYDHRDGTFQSQPRLRTHASSCQQPPSSLQQALTRLFNLMQTSPSKCQTDVSYLVRAPARPPCPRDRHPTWRPVSHRRKLRLFRSRSRTRSSGPTPWSCWRGAGRSTPRPACGRRSPCYCPTCLRFTSQRFCRCAAVLAIATAGAHNADCNGWPFECGTGVWPRSSCTLPALS
jgi:hypothetical protein